MTTARRSPVPPDHRSQSELSAAKGYVHYPEAASRQKEASPPRATVTERFGVWADRGVNLALALVLLILTVPLWIVVAVAIKLTSRGPVMYSQVRVGRDERNMRLAAATDPRRKVDFGGRPFKIYKFRTMVVDAEHTSGPVWATRGDPRITRVGRLLRELRLDELPQLLNVIKGEMNLVGPRPERPTFVVELRRKIPDYPERHKVKPGLTGLAQVNMQYDSCVDTVRAKLEYDLTYIRERSLLKDAQILLKTIPVVLFRRGGW